MKVCLKTVLLTGFGLTENSYIIRHTFTLKGSAITQAFAGSSVLTGAAGALAISVSWISCLTHRHNSGFLEK